MDNAVNKGYLLENFRLFHLKDRRAQPVEPHYHEFHKIVLLISGAVDYTVEGVCYRMQPGDLLLVHHHDIHRPEISPEAIYDRIVLWVRPEFLESCGTAGEPMNRCFDGDGVQRSGLYRPAPETAQRIRKAAMLLEKAMADDAFGRETMVRTCFLQLMVECNRCVSADGPTTAGDVDLKIDEVLRYINTHLAEALSVDRLAAMCYRSRYYFMRSFKEATGYTVHGYIQQKRLTHAIEQAENGAAITDAALSAGFAEYSSFLRAFHKAYGISPRAYLQQKTKMESEYRE